VSRAASERIELAILIYETFILPQSLTLLRLKVIDAPEDTPCYEHQTHDRSNAKASTGQQEFSSCT
jgi:hypothetical protein